jgi:hypothetical protein
MPDDQPTPWTPTDDGSGEVRIPPAAPPDPVFTAAFDLLRRTVGDESAPLAVRVQAAAAIVQREDAKWLCDAVWERRR